MFNEAFAKSSMSSLIVIAVVDLCLSDKIEMLENEAAVHFANQWLAIPKMYVGVILPNKYSFKVQNVVKLTKKIAFDGEGKSAYFMIHSNLTIFKTIPHTQKELIWYPFDTKHYDMDCLFLGSPRYDRLYEKHFLFLHEDRKNNTFPLRRARSGLIRVWSPIAGNKTINQPWNLRKFTKLMKTKIGWRKILSER